MAMILVARSQDLWLPGQSRMESEASKRVEQIARSREELLKLLEVLPEPERELSFTDLVEKVTPICEHDGSKAMGNFEVGEEKAKEVAKEIVKAIRRDSRRTRRNSSSFGGGGVKNGGVLLNVYVPPSFAQNLNSSRWRRSSSSLEQAPSFRKSSERGGSPTPSRIACSTTPTCWPPIWSKGKSKPRN